MEHLDLNSQADGFPNLGSYQEYLQADDVGGDHGLPPRAPGGRVVGHGGGRGGRWSRSTNTGAGSGGGRVGSCGGAVATRGGRGGSHGGSMVHRGGSSVAGHTFEPPEQLGAFEDEEEDGSEARSQSKKPERKKFMYEVPTYLEQLSEMFHGVTVDGSTSYIPGYAAHDSEGVYGDEDGEDTDGEGFVESPMSSDNRKRASSTTDTATSPPKKSKSPMLKMFQGLLTELQIARSKEEEALAEMAKQRQEDMQRKKKQREEEMEKKKKEREEEMEKKKKLREEEMEKKKKLREEEKQVEKDEKHRPSVYSMLSFVSLLQ
ncbi:hypothetical protein ABZP36_007998 [Zizania latifolia]